MSRRFLNRLEKEKEKEDPQPPPSESESEDFVGPTFNFNLLQEEFSIGGDIELDFSPEEVKVFTKNKNKKSRKALIPAPCSQSKQPTLSDLINSTLKLDSRKMSINNELKDIFRLDGGRDLKLHRDNAKRDIFGKAAREWTYSYKNPGIQMQRRDDNKFVFVYNKAYQMAEKQFLVAVRSGDVHAIMQIRDLLPFHINSILLSAQHVLREDTSKAMEFVELALFTYKMVFDVHFNVTASVSSAGELRLLDFNVYENRTFYYALNMYMQLAKTKLCFKTALELAKLIFSLDPFEDPLGILLIIDHLCLLAKDYKFLFGFYSSFRDIKNLDLLPNFAYSLALAKYYIESTESGILAMCHAIKKFPLVITWFRGLSVNCPSNKRIGYHLMDAMTILYSALNDSLFQDSSGGGAVVELAIRRLESRDEYNFDLIFASFISECENSSTTYTYFPLAVARRMYFSRIEDLDFYVHQVANHEDSIYEHDPLPPKNSVMASPSLVDYDSGGVVENLRLVSFENFVSNILPDGVIDFLYRRENQEE